MRAGFPRLKHFERKQAESRKATPPNVSANRRHPCGRTRRALDCGSVLANAQQIVLPEFERGIKRVNLHGAVRYGNLFGPFARGPVFVAVQELKVAHFDRANGLPRRDDFRRIAFAEAVMATRPEHAIRRLRTACMLPPWPHAGGFARSRPAREPAFRDRSKSP